VPRLCWPPQHFCRAARLWTTTVTVRDLARVDILAAGQAAAYRQDCIGRRRESDDLKAEDGVWQASTQSHTILFTPAARSPRHTSAGCSRQLSYTVAGAPRSFRCE
jgi:hypothetical protein